MKKLALIGFAAVLVIGCSRHHGIDTGKLSSSFKGADPALETEADTAIKAIRDNKLLDALAELQKLAKRAKLSAEQQQLVRDVIVQIQTKMEADAKNAAAKKS
jgi:uncharacterized protein YihD (DUF1040 family)